MEKWESFCTAGGNGDCLSHCGKQYGDNLNKLKMDFDPAIPLLGMYPKEIKTVIQKNISTCMLIEALIPITKIWKETKCLLIDEWMKQLWDIYEMECN